MATLSLTNPVVGGSEDTWGTTLNANFDAISAFIGALDSTELAVLDGITATTAELNILDGATVTAAELNILDGATVTVAEVNYLSGVTSAIQTQLDTLTTDKAPLASPALTGTPTVPTAAVGTDTTQAASTAFVQQEVSNGIFDSGELSYTHGGLTTVAHGLSTQPRYFELSAICKTADVGFAVGEIVELTGKAWNSDANNYGHVIWSDATNVYIRTASLGIRVIDPVGSGGFGAVTTAARWRYLLRAKAVV